MRAVAVKSCRKILSKICVDICYAGRCVEKCNFMLENVDSFDMQFYVEL